MYPHTTPLTERVRAHNETQIITAEAMRRPQRRPARPRVILPGLSLALAAFFSRQSGTR